MAPTRSHVLMEAADPERRNDLVLIDYNLPSMNGLKIVDAAMCAGAQVGMFALMTGEPRLHVVKQAQRLGVKLVRKPFSIDELDAVIDSATVGENAGGAD